MIELSIVRDIVAIAGVFTGLSYYIINVRQQQQNRETQLFLSMYQRFDDPILMRVLIDSRDYVDMSFEDWMDNYGPNANREFYTNWVCFQNAIQGIGHMVRDGKIKPQTVNSLMGAIVALNWDRNERFIIGLREALGMPSVWKGCEELRNTIRNL
jgi:hypothetical protein